jgi:hypothetical protein
MFRLTTTALIAASLLGIFVVHGMARGRSFPIEVTGTIRMFDRANQTFMIEVDEPARVLTIGLRHDCKFKQNGVPAGEQILKKGARVRVSYFATIFTGNLAVEIETNPRPQLESGVVERIELAERRLIIRLTNSSHRLALRWAANARFISRGKTFAPAKLREGTAVNVSYYSPAFESKYAVKVEAQPPF